MTHGWASRTDADRQNVRVPRILRPDPPPPLSAAIATRVFGSEVLIGLIRHYRANGGSQIEAAAALDLPQNVVSRNTTILIKAGVVVANPPASGRRAGRYIVDELRVRELAAALVSYTLDDESAG